jgi:hypothetical protein
MDHTDHIRFTTDSLWGGSLDHWTEADSTLPTRDLGDELKCWESDWIDIGGEG